MQTNKYVYALVMTVILSAWFSSYRIPSIHKTKTANVAQWPSRIVSNIVNAGVKVGGLRAGGKCNIEYINGMPMDGKLYSLSREGSLILSGWALDEKNLRLPDSVIIRFKNIYSNKEFFAKAQIGLKRSDVQEHFKLSTNLVASGFRLITYLHDFASGKYDVMILAVFPDSTYVCDNGRKIQIR